jgi:soluble lytic murein transglycosylase-like protein
MKRLILAIPLLLSLGCRQQHWVAPAQAEVKQVCPPMLTRFVQKTNAALTPTEAERIAGIIEKVADEQQIDVILFAAVIRQESHFKNGIKSCRSVHGRRSCDYGIAQVNTFWVDEWELDAGRLKNDVEYNITVAAKILKGVLVKGKGDKYAYSLYNSATPEHRAAYQERIEKYKKIAEALRV